MKILYATDGSAGALTAAHFLSRFDHRRDTHVHVLHIAEEGIKTSTTPEDSRNLLDSAREALGTFPGHITMGTTKAHCSTSGVIERIQVAAEMLLADMIVTGSRGMGTIARFFLGSVALGVARHAPCSVLVGRSPDGPLTRIVVGIDSSESAVEVVRFVSRLPLPKTCKIQLVHVAIPLATITHSGSLLPDALEAQLLDNLRAEHAHARERLVEAADILRTGGWEVSMEMRFGDPAVELMHVARGDIEKQQYTADLLVVGALSQSKLDHYLLGSVSTQIIGQAPCSVLIVR